MLENSVNTSKISNVFSRGFALPTVLIASTIMMSLLLLSVQANTAVRAEINAQYYNQQARLASESGAARAQQCLKISGGIATWTDVKPLTPATDCSGNVVGGYSAYVLSNSTVRTSFSVPAPVIANGTQRISVNGKVDLLRTSSNTVWRSYSQALVSQTGADVSFSNVTFGYHGLNGAFFGTIGLNGDVNALGYNGSGQLGTGDTTSGTIPRPFVLPGGVRAVGLYSNFLSVGYQMFALTTDGDVYGAGWNSLGQLGNGIMSDSAAVPAKFILPAGVKATYVGVLGQATFVIGDDNNVYAAGNCAYGILGSNYTISGCTNRSTYVRVNLPTPNLGDTNTLPVASPGATPPLNFALDRYDAYLLMQGGRVYTWGINDHGQGGVGNTTQHSSPVQMGVYGNSGQPRATQVAFDGDASYILDNTGVVQAAGIARFGDMGGAPSHIQHNGTGMCMNNAYNLTTWSRARLYDCVSAVSENQTFEINGAITTHPNSSTTLCLDNQSQGTADGNPVNWWPCNTTAAQKWDFRDDGSIYNPGSGKCLDDYNNTTGNDAPLNIWTCDGGPAQSWGLPANPSLAVVPLPDPVTRIATDQWTVLFLTSTGEVWGAGGNDKGQIGNGVMGKNISPKLTKMILPAGRTAVNIYTTKTGPQGYDAANSYAILDDGSVWGCGSNQYGQLGNGTSGAAVATPVKMNLPAGVKAKVVQSGLGTTVVLTTTGAIYTVGNNANGQLGDGTTTNSSTPKANRYTNVIPLVLF